MAKYGEERWRLIERDMNEYEWWNEMAKVSDKVIIKSFIIILYQN